MRRVPFFSAARGEDSTIAWNCGWPEIWCLLAASGIVLLGAVSCGAYRQVVANAPFGAGRVFVAPFGEAGPVGMAATVAAELSRCLAAGGVLLAHAPQDADAVLGGEILGASTTSSPTSGIVGSSIPAYRIQMRVQVTLTDARGQVLWRANMVQGDDFLPSDFSAEPVFTDAMRRRAMDRVAVDVARRVHRRLVLDSATRDGWVLGGEVSAAGESLPRSSLRRF